MDPSTSESRPVPNMRVIIAPIHAGRSVPVNSEVVAKIRAEIVADPVLRNLRTLRTMHLGPDDLLVTAEVTVSARATAGSIAEAIEAATERARAVVPSARQVYSGPGVPKSRGKLPVRGTTVPVER